MTRPEGSTRDAVSIAGARFGCATGVWFGSVAAENFEVVSDSETTARSFQPRIRVAR